jgi:hypothetical protein
VVMVLFYSAALVCRPPWLFKNSLFVLTDHT